MSAWSTFIPSFSTPQAFCTPCPKLSPFLDEALDLLLPPGSWCGWNLFPTFPLLYSKAFCSILVDDVPHSLQCFFHCASNLLEREGQVSIDCLPQFLVSGTRPLHRQPVPGKPLLNCRFWECGGFHHCCHLCAWVYVLHDSGIDAPQAMVCVQLLCFTRLIWSLS